MNPEETLGVPIILDLGSASIKLGFSGDSFPKYIIPNQIGIPKYPRSLLPATNEIFVGNQVTEFKGLLNVFDVIENGTAADMDKLFKMFDYIYGHSVLNVDPREHPILITEPVLSSFRMKDAITEVRMVIKLEHLFESLNVPAISFAIAPVLSLYGNGFTTGCVLDSGAGVTSVSCVCDGFSLIHSFKRTNIAGKTVSEFLFKNLFREGHYFCQRSSFHIIEDIKKAICQVSPVQYNIDSFNSSNSSVPYSLPDGSVINLSRSRFMAPEVLFQPLLIGEEFSGFHNLLHDTIRTVDHEVRKKLYKNLMLSGGSTLFPGTEQRLLHEMKLLTGNQCSIKIHSPKNKITSAFKGGSIITMLDSYKPIWISRKDYIDKRKK